MTITKFGHCCLLIKENGLTILTDPGAFSSSQNNITGIDLILITHEHQDHFHVDSLKQILQNNPGVQIFTNKGVGKILDQQGIAYTLLEHGQAQEFKGVSIEGFGEKHALIYDGVPDVENTGYMVAGKFFYPGDAFFAPSKPVEILALPIVGPWMKISEALDYAKQIKPRIAFPVHDALLNPQFTSFWPQMVKRVLEPMGIEFAAAELGKEIPEIK